MTILIETENIKTQNSPFLIVGLGNPGREYRANRHNVGFMVVDRLAVRLGVAFTRLESRALVTKSEYQDHKLVLVKPQTYMNLSGQPVNTLVRFYKSSLENMLVIYDDVDLPYGILRLRPSGGSAGQKGLVSIIEKLATQDFPRMRVGIGRPPGRMETAGYVLQDFSGEDAEFLPATLDRAVDAVFTFITEGIVSAMNKFNPKEAQNLHE